MHQTSTQAPLQAPLQALPATRSAVITGHIDDAASMTAVCAALAALHGAEYAFRVERGQGETTFTAPRGRQCAYFVMQTAAARAHLTEGQRVRGVPQGESYRRDEPHWATVIAPAVEELWPGDVVGVMDGERISISGGLTCFVVESDATAYPLPAVAFLRHLDDRPGGCAAYPGAFRREALPPVRAAAGEVDQRGVNRVNEHTLDMRHDRDPRPRPHHHGPVITGLGEVVNHSETALVLPRAAYHLPPVAGSEVDGVETGHVVIYHQPAVDPTDVEIVPVRAGSVIVTPAATGGVAGHRFDNAFAMLVAIPGFVSPHYNISPQGDTNTGRP